MTLPENIEDNYFATWQALSQLRKAGNYQKGGLIAELDFKWIGPRQFVLSSNDTDNWPIGRAQLDVLFTSNTGRRLRTKKLTVHITHGITTDS